MAAERRRVEKELPRQTHAAWLPPSVAQTTASAGKRAATRTSRFRTARRRASDTPSSTDDEQREPAFRASVAAHLRCRIIARPGCCVHGACPWPGPGPRSCRPPRRRGRARPCPRTMRQPNPGAPASGGRRCAARRPPWPRPAARRARTRRPPSAPRGGAHRCTAQAAPAPGAECAPISGTGAGPDPQPESRRAVGCVVERTLGRAAMT